MDVKARIEQLINTINKYNYEYYTLDTPSVSDREYDRLMAELLSLEKKHPEFKNDDSPSVRVGGKRLGSFSKVTHKIPMLSLGNVFNYEELESFFKDVNLEYVCEYKIDGYVNIK